MIDINKFRESLQVVEAYSQQIQERKSVIPNQVGCVVKLSRHGLEMQGKRKKNFVGKVIDFLEWHGSNDGLVTVKWETKKIPEVMHVTQVECL